MDPERFDGLVRSLSGSTSRRAALATLAGTLAALGAAAGAAAAPGSARHRQDAKPASTGGALRPAEADQTQRPDARGAHRPRRHRHHCLDGQTSCPAKHHKHVCVDLQTDAAHCGDCGLACGDGQSCLAAHCVGGCTPKCDGRHCGDDGCGGSCGVCLTGQTCNASGQCEPCVPLTTCPAGACGAYPDQCGGALDCPACGGNGCLVCGPNFTCVPTCDACHSCSAGSCIAICPPGCSCPSTFVCATDQRCVKPGGGGCFVAGTRVAMADGTSRPIEDVAIGDWVLGGDGRANRVLGVERPYLGDRLLYALNGSQPFVTAEHPFATEQGWKAVDPAAMRRAAPALAVSRLTLGDRLLRLAAVAAPVGGGSQRGRDDIALRLEPVTLRELSGQAADPATPLYNLLLDGDHAYFADDLLVHNKPRQRR